MKKVLIITYYWPPSGGSGVQRWLKFVKYLPGFGWEPHVFTPENPSFAITDQSLQKDVPPEAEVMRLPIWEPYDLFFKISGLFGASKKSTPTALVPSRNRTLVQRMSTWVRGNFFIPDPRVFWIKPSSRFLADYIPANGIKLVITTGPPHSIHLIGLALKKKFPELKWLADFRDPWTEWGMWDSLAVSKPIRRIHKRMEDRVLAIADDIITITPFYARRFEKLSGRPVRLLTNGFDEDDFKGIVYKRSEQFMIRHVGLINERCDPRPFMNALKGLMAADESFRTDVALEFIGEVHADFRDFVNKDPVLHRISRFPGNVPHDTLISLYGSSSLLLLILTGYKDAEGFLPGKLFEYLATGLPVLGVGPPDGDAATLLKESGAGVMVASENETDIAVGLKQAYLIWKNHADKNVELSRVNKFSRRKITGQLAIVLEEHLNRSKSGQAMETGMQSPD